jgi:transcriptional regulator with XRE-family HTH domain
MFIPFSDKKKKYKYIRQNITSMELGIKIKKIRESKNYTQEYMSNKLNISQNTYSKIETGGIKLTVDRLKQISEVLDVSVEDILNNESQVFNFHNSNIDKFYGYIETLHEDNKELLQTTIKLLNEQITYLKSENEKLLKIISKQS